MHPVIEVQELGMVYGGRFAALEGISMAVYPGERISVIGRSGAGKSTLLRIMNRLLTPTSGRLLLDEADVTHAQGAALRLVRRRVGMIFQQFNLVSRLSVLDNVLVGTLAHRRGLSTVPTVWRQFSRAERDWALACLGEVGIANLAGKRATELSGGQQQRVAIARLLAQRAEVILADEPVASLDPYSAEQVMRSLRRINEEHGVAVITNLHQVGLAREFSTRIIGLRQGRMCWDLEPAEMDSGRLEMLYGDQTDDADINEQQDILIEEKPHAQPAILGE